MSRYPNLPPALHRLLEAGPWQGTPTELYATLEAHRVEPWPANPVALSLWLKHHAREHSITVEALHTGEHRLLRLVRESNGLKGATIPAHSGTIPPHNAAFLSFPTWAKLEAALPGILEAVSGEVTLAFDLGQSRVSQAVPITWLPGAVGRWAAQFPHALEVRIYPGAVEVSTVWPLF
ncbi:MAG: hypothetical protein KatS3mg070_2412 [Meiothermus sp.]|uniref:hypothetical protein n=1 Tax=Meiothermus sp. TaxID=1955249 RepID=UPI0021DC2751|nr:hypothetical protein [Meiothermus sp.]GIW29049.1 MAG: hypothetical protein KatS3mg070_2412 [Meiothermus sp.]